MGPLTKLSRLRTAPATPSVEESFPHSQCLSGSRSLVKGENLKNTDSGERLAGPKLWLCHLPRLWANGPLAQASVSSSITRNHSGLMSQIFLKRGAQGLAHGKSRLFLRWSYRLGLPSVQGHRQGILTLDSPHLAAPFPKHTSWGRGQEEGLWPSATTLHARS